MQFLIFSCTFLHPHLYNQFLTHIIRTSHAYHWSHHATHTQRTRNPDAPRNQLMKTSLWYFNVLTVINVIWKVRCVLFPTYLKDTLRSLCQNFNTKTTPQHIICHAQFPLTRYSSPDTVHHTDHSSPFSLSLPFLFLCYLRP